MIELTVPALSCEHCVRIVGETVRRVDAQARVDVDLGGKRVRIESSLPRERFAAALGEEGYPPDPATD